MVEIATSLGRSGLQDWLIQRLTALIIAPYTLFVIGFLFSGELLNFSQWQALFHNPWMRFFSLLTLISLLAHAWIGLWTVTTDYLKRPVIRLATQVFIMISLLGCLFFGAVTVLGGIW